MSQTSATTAERPVLGRMFLYEQPQLLTKEEHGGLGLSAVPQPYDFARRVRALPLVTLEFPVAQRDYPIVFSDSELPAPLAV
ncbi:MAG TPA: SapC family protein, partial [Woeseiaceae bacterium]|nr:SapC family protein [Woeseiaceae bacterium]